MRNIFEDETIRIFLDEALPLLRSGLGACRVILFGSRVRGSATPDSDLDVIVVSDRLKGIPFLRRSAFLRRMIGFPHPIDIIGYTADEFERIPATSAIVRAALREGLEAA